MKIEAVTICINFSNILEKCLVNKEFLDRWVIVTEKNDLDTINLCKKNNLEYVLSERVHENKAPLAKGKAINDGFDVLDKNDWILHLDADIILLPGLKESINKVISKDSEKYKSLFSTRARRGLELEKHRIIGYRCTKKYNNLCKLHDTFNDRWIKIIKSNRLLTDYELIKFFLEMKEKGLFESKLESVNKQWQYYNSGKWNKLPYIFEGPQINFIGYFQLFHSSTFEKYPEESDTIAWDDTFFTNKYPKSRKVVLDYECIHIGYNGASLDLENELGLDNLEYHKDQLDKI